MTIALKPRLDIAQENKMWRAIKNGSFVEKYTDSLKEYMTPLQKAIDTNAETVRIVPKTEIEEGDLQMFDGKGWQPFNIHIARDLIINQDMMIAIRQFLNGQWVDQNELTDSFNKSFSDVRDSKKKHYTFLDHCNSDDWYKMARQDQDLNYRQGLRIVGKTA